MSVTQPSLGIVQRGLLAVMLVGASFSLYWAGVAAFADVLMLQARWQATQWQLGKQMPPKFADWGRVRNGLVAAQAWVPGDPQIHEQLGYLYGLRAVSAHGIPDLEQAMLDETINYYRQAVRRRPMAPYAWANLSLALHFKAGQDKAMWQAYDRAYQYGKKEGGVQRTLAEIGFSHWDEAGAQRQAQLIELVNGALAYTRTNLVNIAARYGRNNLIQQ